MVNIPILQNKVNPQTEDKTKLDIQTAEQGAMSEKNNADISKVLSDASNNIMATIKKYQENKSNLALHQGRYAIENTNTDFNINLNKLKTGNIEDIDKEINNIENKTYHNNIDKYITDNNITGTNKVDLQTRFLKSQNGYLDKLMSIRGKKLTEKSSVDSDNLMNKSLTAIYSEPSNANNIVDDFTNYITQDQHIANKELVINKFKQKADYTQATADMEIALQDGKQYNNFLTKLNDIGSDNEFVNYKNIPFDDRLKLINKAQNQYKTHTDIASKTKQSNIELNFESKIADLSMNDIANNNDIQELANNNNIDLSKVLNKRNSELQKNPYQYASKYGVLDNNINIITPNDVLFSKRYQDNQYLKNTYKQDIPFYTDNEIKLFSNNFKSMQNNDDKLSLIKSYLPKNIDEQTLSNTKTQIYSQLPYQTRESLKFNDLGIIDDNTTLKLMDIDNTKLTQNQSTNSKSILKELQTGSNDDASKLYKLGVKTNNETLINQAITLKNLQIQYSQNYQHKLPIKNPIQKDGNVYYQTTDTKDIAKINGLFKNYIPFNNTQAEDDVLQILQDNKLEPVGGADNGVFTNIGNNGDFVYQIKAKTPDGLIDTYTIPLHKQNDNYVFIKPDKTQPPPEQQMQRKANNDDVFNTLFN